MLNKLNYFNKLICTFLVAICVIFCKNLYLNIVLIILPFIYLVFINNYRLSILAAILAFTYAFVYDLDSYIIFYKIFIIFIYYLCMKTTFTKREKIIFINRIFYRIKPTKELIKKIYYKDLYNKNKKKLNGKKYIDKNKTYKELEEKYIIARTKYYGNHKKRKEYGLTTWSKFDSTVLCITIFIVVVCLLY